MAKTWGYALSGFASGLGTGFSMKMEKAKIDALKEEQRRLEKAQKEAERLFQEWYNSPETKEFCANLETASQGERAYFITGARRIGEDIFKYFTEIDNDIREGNIEAAKSKNDLLETKIKSATDLAALGMTAVFPDGSPMKISPEDIEFQKQIQIGKMAGGPTSEAMGREMWRGRGLGEITPTPKEPDLPGAITYLKKFPNPTPGQFSSLKTGAEKYFNVDLSDVTQESLWKPVVPTEEPTPAPTSTENVRESILNADTFEDARRIYKNYADKYDEAALGIDDIDKFWGNARKSDLDNLVSVLNEITAGTPEGRNVKGNKEFTFDMDGKEVTKTGEEWYGDIYESYNALLKLLEELGIDISQYKRLKPISEIKKIKFGGFVGSGVETGDLTFIYY